MWTIFRGITGTVWVAKNYPDYVRIRADYAVLDKTAGADTDMTPALSTLPGMVVRSQVSGGGWYNHAGPYFGQGRATGRFAVYNLRHDKEVLRPTPLKQVIAQPAPSKVSGGSTPKTPGTATWNHHPKSCPTGRPPAYSPKNLRSSNHRHRTLPP